MMGKWASTKICATSAPWNAIFMPWSPGWEPRKRADRGYINGKERNKETKKQRKQKQELGWERWGSSSLEDFSAGGFSFKITDVLYYQECGCPQPLEVYWWTVKLLKLKAALCRDASPAEQPGGLGDGFETSKQSNNKEQELQSLKRCSEHEGSEK